MAKIPADIRSLCRAYTDANIRALGAFASAVDVPVQYRIQAIGMLLDRGYGKPATPHTGADGEGDIRITIRNIIEEKKDKK